MHAFVTGATGFLGGRLVRQLRAAGHGVTALVRSPAAAEPLADLGVRVVPGDVTDRASLAPMRGCDTVFHLAAWYELGVADAARMRDVNVGGTAAVLGAAAAYGCATVVHCSSVAALGSTGGALVNEDHPRSGAPASAYEETKAEAHALALDFARRGLPVRIALPGTIFGPGDTSLVAKLFEAHLARRLVAFAFADLAMSLVYVDDCAAGLVLAAERGRPGGAYNLVGEVITMGAWVERIAAITGYGAPRVYLPTGVAKAFAPLFPLVAPLLDLAPGTVRDGIRMADGKSWRFDAARARAELGWRPGDFDVALARTLLAADRKGGARFHPVTAKAAAALAAARGLTPT
jgi:dihydroflavonol-4-reductase